MFNNQKPLRKKEYNAFNKEMKITIKIMAKITILIKKGENDMTINDRHLFKLSHC